MQSKPTYLSRAIYIILAILFVALAIYGSLVPFRFHPIEFEQAWKAFIGDFQSLTFSGSRVDLGVNVLLFVPISFFCLQACVGESTSRIRRAATIVVVVAACMTISLGVEFAQNWFPPRVPSARDVFAQVIGTSIGVMIWLAVGATATEWLQLYLTDRRPAQQIHWLLQAYAIGLIIYSLMPLDLTASPHEIYQKIKSDRVALLPFTHDYGGVLNTTYALVSSTLLFVPIGMLAASVLTTPKRSPSHFVISMLIGFSIVLGIEFSQLLVMSRFTDSTDVITGSVGVAIGIWGMRRWRSEPGGADIIKSASVPRSSVAFEWLLIAGAYAVILVILYWAPFDFMDDKQQIRDALSGFFRIPLSAALRGSPFGAVTSLLRKVLLFVPLGLMFAMATRRLPVRFRRFLLAILLSLGWCLALGIELGQVILPNRVAVFDDVFVCTLGVFVGIVATSRIVSRAGATVKNSPQGLRP